MTPVLDDIVQERFKHIDAQKYTDPHDEKAYVLVGYIVIDDIFGDDRVEQIAACYDESTGHIQNKQPQVRFIVF